MSSNSRIRPFRVLPSRDDDAIPKVKHVPVYSHSWSNEGKLMYFVGRGELARAKELIDKGTEVNYVHKRGTTGNSCLHLAVSKSDLKMTKMLLDAGAKTDVVNKYGHAPLHLGAAKEFGLLKLLIDRGAGVNVADATRDKSEGCYPLHMAARAGKADAVEYLIEKGAEVNVFNKFGHTPSHTPLHIAATKGLDLSKLLIEKGANVNAFDPKPLEDKVNFEVPEGATKPDSSKRFCYPLHMAVGAAKLDVVELLIERGADVDAIDAQGRSILYYAVKRNAGEILTILLKSGAKIDSDVGQRAAVSFMKLSKAYRERRRRFVIDCHGHLVRAPEDVEIDSIAMSETDPLFLAVGERGKIHIVKMLLDAGAKIKISRHKREFTALHEAAKWGRRNIIELLLKRGADVKALDGADRSVLNHAALCEHNPDIKRDEYNEILHLLFSHGAPIGNRKELLRGAILRGNVDTLRLLFRHGIKLEEVNKWTYSEKPTLHLATSNSDVNVLKYLLNSALFDVDAQERPSGDTALHVSIENKYLIHTKVLLECHPNLDLRNSNTGMTAIDLAVNMGLEKTIELLLFACTDFTAHPRIRFREDISIFEFTPQSFRLTRNSSIRRHQIKYTALLNVLCNRLDSSGEYIVPTFSSFSGHKNYADEYYKKCIAEIKLMQGSLLQDQITFYDIFSFVGFTRCIKKIRAIDVMNNNTLEECFPIYGKQIRQKLGQISNIRRLQCEAIRGLSVLLRKNVEPYQLITEKILAHLTDKDLRVLRAIAAFHGYH